MVNSQDKQITLEDVAKRAKVSIKTVSRVINNEPYVGEATRHRVSVAIQELNYHPNRAARRLASRQSHVIGMLVPSIAYPVFPIVILGVEKVMHQHNYEVLVYNTEVVPERSRKGLELLAENQVDGVMVFTINNMADEELQQLLRRQREVVLVNNTLSGSDAGVVRIDIIRGIELLIEHLVAAGRRRIALMTFPKNNYSANERRRGYQHALTKFGLPAHDELIIICEDSEQGIFDKVQDVFTNGPEVDAMICYNDLMAVTVMKACFELGISIPDQVAVTGFDNIPFTDFFRCPLTTVSIDWFNMGVTAAEMLLNRIRQQETPPEVVLMPELVVRESTP